ncbi:diaminopimelate decarboxylase [Chloracidobacterium thermophilum]|jgi:diaminopimelate decarboxylase|uniref:Diaminopimelate decarboxylase n=1 Tax=Chloracidobacterium thermophilum (strain B) TaxID=981222 RepID=G2LIJ6_CHLTF|nr:diaminopimelate decarboxylase [Chloracidobacterium thermophilum]AEP11894.1 diaminopimelate decarboxylase [Chloracidobacterium thermophilum B]QUV79756.1 diaminopimelate decarboxylase [Chloracidobacterium thermophilum]
MLLDYIGDSLHFGREPQCCLRDFVAGRTEPCYLYDLRHFTERYRCFRSAFAGLPHTIHYAVKANAHPVFLRRVVELGGGADVVSGGELQRALDSGVPPERVIFSGVGKSHAELRLALTCGIKQINVESVGEMRRIIDLAEALGRPARIAFRFNPSVDAETHPYIATGFRSHKFGIDAEAVMTCLALARQSARWVQVVGVSLHIGSQIVDVENFAEALRNTRPLVAALREQGFALSTFDVGGGFGIHYDTGDEARELENFARYAEVIRQGVQGLAGEILFEPGRFLVARCGVLLARVEYVKTTPYKTFVIVNTGMHHLIRPALYQAHHRILPVVQRAGPSRVVDVVGPLCESSDFLAQGIELPEVREGDWLAIADAGAYARSMASEYNLHPFPDEEFIVE